MTNRKTGETDLDEPLKLLAQLVNRVVKPSGPDAYYDAYARMGPVWALRSPKPTEPSHALYAPMLCIIAQGAKQVLLGDECHVYGRGHFLLNSVALPAAAQVIEATAQEPCLWMMIELDAALVASVITEVGVSAILVEPQRAMESCPLDRPLLDAVLRLAQLFELPEDAGFLAPLLLREIVYRLLQSTQAVRLHQIASHGGRTLRVIHAIEWLHHHFAQPLSVEQLAKESGMSQSALHQHFKEVTAMSPLQFQKQMRLQEAKRLMVSQGLDVASAGYKVGYDDPSYFSRDYRRFFGVPPRQHMVLLQRDIE